MRRLAAIALLVLASCSGGEPSFDREDLPRLVLQADDAPTGTALDEGTSGYRDLEGFAEDENEEDALRTANFREAYIAFFPSPGALSPTITDPKAALAVSYALLFATPDDARAGLDVLHDDIRSDGTGLSDRPAEGLGEGAFGLAGDIQPGRPPGFVFGWRVGNVVQALVAAGAPGAIDEDAVRVLVDRAWVRARG